MNLVFESCQIRHDGLQYILAVKQTIKTGKNKGKEDERILGYYGNERHLLSGVIKCGLGSECVSSVEDIGKIVEEALEKVSLFKKTP